MRESNTKEFVKALAEIVVNYVQGVDYNLVRQNSFLELRILRDSLKKRYGESIVVAGDMQATFTTLLFFAGEDTPRLWTMYKSVLEKLAELGFRVKVFVYDCDEETAKFLCAIESVAPLLENPDFSSVLSISTMVLTLRSLADRVKELRARAAESNASYSEYSQLATKVSSYLSKLLKLVDSPSLVERLISIPDVAGKCKSKFLEVALTREVYYYSEVFSECPKSISEALRNLWSKLESEGATYIIAPEELTTVYAKVIQASSLVTISQES
mgnify:CR=1 FL=1